MGVCLQNASPVIGASLTRSNKYIDLPAPENLSTCSSVYSQPPGASKIERSVRAPRCARLARGLEDDYPVPASRCVRSPSFVWGCPNFPSSKKKASLQRQTYIHPKTQGQIGSNKAPQKAFRIQTTLHGGSKRIPRRLHRKAPQRSPRKGTVTRR